MIKHYFIDYTGTMHMMKVGDKTQRFELVGNIHTGKNGKGTMRYANFRCLFCGGIKEASLSLVYRGVVACACYNSHVRHGLSHSRIYGIWIGMKTRCLNKKDKFYKNYGKRGIGISDDRLHNFENFHRDMDHTYLPGLQLDRIDNEKGYSKENCRRVDRYVQNQNTRKNVYYNGKTISQRARELGISKNTINVRRLRGMPIKEAIFTPVVKIQQAVNGRFQKMYSSLKTTGNKK